MALGSALSAGLNAGLGGFGQQQQEYAERQRQYYLELAQRQMAAAPRSVHLPEPPTKKTFRQQLQSETDEWLKLYK
jgi:hypothetical protein